MIPQRYYFHLFLALLIFRSLNSLSIVTFFDPDEYWQSLEVAHQYVYGRGYLTCLCCSPCTYFIRGMVC